jgi:patatin-like phospholipase/acyl hydrolase
MKPLNKIILLSLVFASLSSCISIVKIINGEKKMKVETHQSIQEFAKEQNLTVDFDRNFYLKKRNQNEVLMNLRSYNNLDKISFPDVYFFNADGQFIEDENLVCYTAKTVSNEFDYYRDFFDSNKLVTSNTKSLADFENEFLNKVGEPTFPFQKKTAETYYAIVLWSKYKGEMWANETNYIIHHLQQSSVDFEIYYLNMDLVSFDTTI